MGEMINQCYGYFVNHTRQCQLCSALNCMKCDVENRHGTCDVCAPGFYRHSTTRLCFLCADQFDGCELCSGKKCERCTEGYVIQPDGQCAHCALDCEDCTKNGRLHCDRCVPGFGLTSDKLCAPCARDETGHWSCEHCVSAGAGRCDPDGCPGFSRFLNNTCESCYDEGCWQCDSDPAICQICDSGLFLNHSTGHCTPCRFENCKECNNSHCVNCSHGFYLDATEQCVECQENCAHCNQFECFECSTSGEHILLTNGTKCYNPCEGLPNQFYGFPPRGVCEWTAPYGGCIDGRLYRHECDPTPFISLNRRWMYEYWMRGYTLQTTCSEPTFSPVVFPPDHYKFNSPHSSHFKEFRDMTPGFIAETVHTLRVSALDKKPRTTGNSATQVGIEIFIFSIYKIDDIRMQFSMTFWLRMIFHDCELAFEGFNHLYEWVTLDNHDTLRYWLPDIYFRSERANVKHIVSSPNVFMRLYKNGTMVVSQKMTITSACNMKLHRFPLDTQDCPLQLASYSYPADELNLTWHDRDEGLALTVYDEAKDMPEFDLTTAEPHSCRIRDTFFGEYSCLEVRLRFSRKLPYYIEQVYLPSTLFVILSWIGPWIHNSVTGARVTIGLLTVLTVVTQAVGANSNLPRVSYLKAVDVWMAACLIQVVGGLVHFCVVNVAAKAQEKAHKDQTEESNLEERFTHSLRGKRRSVVFMMKLAHVRRTDRAHFIDLVARALFPAIFLVFNLVYWSYYLAYFTENPK